MLARNRISDRFTEGEGSQARYESRGGADESPVAAFQARFLLGARKRFTRRRKIYQDREASNVSTNLRPFCNAS